MAETELKDFQNRILQLAPSSIRDTVSDRKRAGLASRTSLLCQLKDLAASSAVAKDACSDSYGRMQLDQDANVVTNTGQNTGSNVVSNGAKMNLAVVNQRMALGSNPVQQLLMATLLGGNGMGLQNKFVAGI